PSSPPTPRPLPYTTLFRSHRQLLRRGLTAHFLQHLARNAVQLVDGLDHVHRDADGARLVRDRARDRLADPPGRVGAELVAAAVLDRKSTRLNSSHVAISYA